ncbi:hypothetical protein NA56DRAFT_645000 [Hyaloscypha hepaticicola]|uniref:Uncharacterized protein n=1 Tax=Hyaloscypha hepaticicola TaxID=2082293 RepID=A0A2J6Q7Q1_9HELO|nr:hypothetical protein NA56DRAFT_645000 [Hyaloscypha hepaticicola]
MRASVSPLLFLFFLTTALALYPNPYLNPTGSLTLFTDTLCQQTASANPWILGGDFCVPLSPSTPSDLNSYLITQRPTCNNGSYASWATYSDARCEKEIQRVPYNNDDVCESFNGVESVAFICEGFVAEGGDGNGGAGSSMSVITATYSEIPISIITKPIPSSYLVTPPTAAKTVTSTPAPTIESTTSGSVSSSTGAPRNGTSTSGSLSAPSALSTGGASTLASCSGFVFLLIPASLLFTGL